MRPHRTRRDAGATLIELTVVLAISSVLIALVVAAMIDFDRTRRPRELTAQIQGEGRDGMARLEGDLRAGALGAPTGVVWAQSDAGVVSRPAVQVFNDVPGGGLLPVKANTDALLVVRADVDDGVAPVTATVGEVYSASTLTVTSGTGLHEGDRVLYGQYGDAAWNRLTGVSGQVLTTAANVLPASTKVRSLPAGSFVRRGHARLYYVTDADELVRAELTVPWAPESAAEVTEVLVLARGVENLQIDCATDDGLTLGGCPAPISAAELTNPLVAEAEDAFGSAAAGLGPRFTAGNVGSLRSLALTVVVRSRRPVDASQGDPAVEVQDQKLTPGPNAGAPGDAPYLRRAYRIDLAIRNTSLGVL